MTSKFEREKEKLVAARKIWGDKERAFRAACTMEGAWISDLDDKLYIEADSCVTLEELDRLHAWAHEMMDDDGG